MTTYNTQTYGTERTWGPLPKRLSTATATHLFPAMAKMDPPFIVVGSCCALARATNDANQKTLWTWRSSSMMVEIAGPGNEIPTQINRKSKVIITNESSFSLRYTAAPSSHRRRRVSIDFALLFVWMEGPTRRPSVWSGTRSCSKSINKRLLKYLEQLN
jgi:hypothetical protein